MADAQLEIPEEIETLGDAVRWLREQRKLSLRALARAVDLTPAFLSDLEHNRRRTNKLEDIAGALRCSAETLKRFDGRLTRDLETWIQNNPQIAPLLRELRSKDQPVARLKRAVRGDED